MSDTKKKEPKVKKEARKKTEVNDANLKVVRSVAVIEYPLLAIRKALACTWAEAVALRKAALKSDKS